MSVQYEYEYKGRFAMKKTVKVLGKFAESVLLAAGFAGLIICRKEISEGVREGIIYSINALLPSLLPFMFLSAVLSRRPLYIGICRVISPVTRYIFHLPEACGGAILSGLCFGYPVGAKMTAELLEKGEIGPEEAGRMLCFCVNPGIAFTVLFLGGEVLDSYIGGLTLYTAVTLACLICGFVLSLGAEKPLHKSLQVKQESFINSVNYGVHSSAKACLSMLMYIVIFRAICSFLEAIDCFAFKSEDLRLIFCFLLEVTTGIDEATKACSSVSIFAFGLGFGGICLIFQLLAFFRKRPAGFAVLFAARLFQSLMSAVLARLMIKFLPLPNESLEVFSSHSVNIPGGLEAEPLGFIFLVLLFGAYILSGSKIGVEKGVKR